MSNELLLDVEFGSVIGVGCGALRDGAEKMVKA
jgi:hypothetical protein